MKFLICCLFFILIPTKIFAIDTKAEQAIVIEFNTNEVLFEKNSNNRIIPASMTKIMTVYVAFDRIKKSEFFNTWNNETFIFNGQ